MTPEPRDDTPLAPSRPYLGLAIQAAVFLAVAGAADLAAGWYAPGHFVPLQKLAGVEGAARRPGGPGLVFSGDSRMVAGMDFGVLRARLTDSGPRLPVSDLTLGAVDVPGQVVALRRVVEGGPAPAVVVLGVVGDTLLEADAPPDPDTLVGNYAVTLALSRPSDVFTLYPGFPLRHLDPGLRFLFARATAVGCYRSLIWMKVKVWQDRLVGRPGLDAANEFGLVGDMVDFSEGLRLRALKRYRDARTPDGGWRFDPGFLGLSDALRRAGVPLVLVEVPMPESYRRSATDGPEGRALRRWLAERCAADSGLYVDLSDADALGLSDADFPDRLHMTPRAARRVTGALADRLAPFFAARGRDRDPR